MTTLPPIETLAATAAQLAETAAEAGDTANANALNKAIWHLSQELQVIPTHGGWLVPSGTRSGVIHRVSETHGCSCEAAAVGRPCWHAAALEIISASQERTARTVSYDEAMAAMSELFA